jgi:hypothetical protein
MSNPPRKSIQVRSALQPELFRLDKRGNPHSRVVWTFDDETRRTQADALRALRSIRFPMPLATGSIPGKTLYDNVVPHAHSTAFYLTDFTDAFGRVQQDVLRQKVDNVLRSRWARGRNHKLARDTIDAYLDAGAFLDGVPGLPQGNATSADLFNWYMADADNALAFALWSGRHECARVATRYLDDLTVSSRDEGGLNRSFRQTVRAIYTNHAPGMEVAHHKSHIRHLDEEHPAVTITGLSLYRDGRITPSRELIASAESVFGDVARRLAEGEDVSDEDYARVAGYNGVLNLPGETARSGSRRIRELGVSAHQLMSRLKTQV